LYIANVVVFLTAFSVHVSLLSYQDARYVCENHFILFVCINNLLYKLQIHLKVWSFTTRTCFCTSMSSQRGLTQNLNLAG